MKLDGTIGDKVHVAGRSQQLRLRRRRQPHQHLLPRIRRRHRAARRPGRHEPGVAGLQPGELLGRPPRVCSASRRTMRLGGRQADDDREQGRGRSRDPHARLAGGGTPRTVLIARTRLRPRPVLLLREAGHELPNFYDSLPRVDPDSLADLVTSRVPATFAVFVDTQDSADAKLQRNLPGFRRRRPAGRLETRGGTPAYAAAPPEQRYPPEPPVGRRHAQQLRHLGQVEAAPSGASASFSTRRATGRRRCWASSCVTVSAERSDAIGVRGRGRDAPGGRIVATTPAREVRLKLIRHPEQDTDFYRYPDLAVHDAPRLLAGLDRS